MEIEHTNTTLDTFNNEAEEKNDNLIHDSLDDTFNDEVEEEHPHTKLDQDGLNKNLQNMKT